MPEIMIEARVEILPAASDDEANRSELQLDLPLARSYYRCLQTLQKEFELTEPVSAHEIAGFHNVITGISKDKYEIEQVWNELYPQVEAVFERLLEARREEGLVLERAIREMVSLFQKKLIILRQKRKESIDQYKEKTKRRIQSVFEAYPITEASAQNILESRITQELVLLLDRVDIEEELTRLDGHMDLFNQTLELGSPAGRKLEFVLQEIYREVNTIGSKAQDFLMQDEVVQLKVLVEQLREQVMNIE